MAKTLAPTLALILLALAPAAPAAANQILQPVVAEDAFPLDHNCAEAKDMYPPGSPTITTECATEN